MKHYAKILCAGLAMLCLHGCGVVRWLAGVPAEHVATVGASPLAHVGGFAVYTGAALLVILCIGRAACYFPATAFLAPFAGLFGEGAALCLVAIVAGCILVWLGGHTWVLLCAGAVAVVAFAWRHKTEIMSFSPWRRIQAPVTAGRAPRLSPRAVATAG